MRRIFGNVVVSVFGTLELYYKTVCKWTLELCKPESDVGYSGASTDKPSGESFAPALYDRM